MGLLLYALIDQSYDHPQERDLNTQTIKQLRPPIPVVEVARIKV